MCEFPSETQPKALPQDNAQLLETPAIGKHDPLYVSAIDLVRKLRIASISAVQRHLRIGYNRTAYMLEAMEGSVISFPDGAGVRQVLPESPVAQDEPEGSDCESHRG